MATKDRIGNATAEKQAVAGGPPKQETNRAVQGAAVWSAVFGAPDIDQRHVGRIVCPECNKHIRYRLRDIGKVVLCPNCKRIMLRIGTTLLEENHRQGRHQQEVDPPPAVMLFPRAPWIVHRMAVALLAVGALGAIAWHFSSSQPLESWLPLGGLSFRSSEVVGDPPSLPQGLPPSPPEITLEAIEELLGWHDARAALVQAQTWQQVLQDFAVPASDPRMVRLAKLIKQLEASTAVKPAPPPPCLEEFRLALQALRDALIAKDLDAAKAAVERADALFRDHPEELTPFGRSLLTLKQRYAQQRREREGRGRIRQLLADAEERLRDDSSTPAAETIAEIKFLAMGTPMEEAEFQALDRKVRDLERELRFARGKCAVENADRCAAENDSEARDAQLALAFDLLPDFSASRVEELLARANKIEKIPIASPTKSAFGCEVLFRTAYEQALHHYGRNEKLTELAEACVVARQRLQTEEHLRGQFDDKLSELLFSALEFEVGDLADRPDTDPDTPVRLAAVRIALQKSNPWQASPRWRAVDATINAKEDDIARNVTKRARQQGDAGQYSTAVETIAPALTLGSPEVRQTAATLQMQWKSLAAQNEYWQEARQLYSDQRYLETWSKLDALERRFPDFPKEKLDQVRQNIRPAVERAVDELIQQATDARASQDWATFRAATDQLETVAMPQAVSATAQFRDAVTTLDEEAETLFGKITKVQRYLATTDDLLAVRDILTEVLSRNPHHEEATQLFARVREKAGKRAADILRIARLAATEESYKSRLQEAITFDPDGPIGAEARELLKKPWKGRE